MKKRILYFGHPVNTYDTPLESRLLFAIVSSTEFIGWELENPNQPRHRQAYDELVALGRSGMEHFFEEVLPSCDGGVFLAFPDGKWPAGVYAEMAQLFKWQRPVWRIAPEGWIERLDELPLLTEVLTVEETRLRIRDTNGQLLPY